MNRRSLANKLINTPRSGDRRRLLTANHTLADEKLAAVIKDQCYASWTSRPQEAQNAARASHSLAKFRSDPLIKAYNFWINGIADLTRGRLESTISNLDRAAREFHAAGNEHEAANTQVAKIYALAMLGKYEEAIACGEQALSIFERFGDGLAAGKIEKNLGNIVARRGDERRAVEYYIAARKRFLKLGEHKELTMADNSLANSYAELNDFLTAEKFYSGALRHAREDKMAVTEAEIEASLGNLAVFRGKLDAALNYLESSRRKYDRLAMPHQTAVAELEIADIYLELNLANEASEIYEDVIPKLKRLKMRAEEARARANFAKALTALSDSAAARKELRRAARLFRAEKNFPGEANTLFSRAELDLAQGKLHQGLRTVQTVLYFRREFINRRQKLRFQLLEAETLINLRREREARKLLSELVESAKKYEQQTVLLRAFDLLGKLDLRAGDRPAAVKHFKKAIEIVEGMRAPLPAEEFRMAFLSDKLAPYEDLARVFIEQKDFEAAFKTVESARARALLEKLSGREENNQPPRGDAALERQLAELREELNWFYSRYDRAEGEEATELFETAAKRERDIAKLTRRIESARRENAGIAQTRAVDLTSIRKNLGKDTVLIEYSIFNGEICAFLVSRHGVKFVSALGTEREIADILEDLRFQFGSLRFGEDLIAKHLPELKLRADKHLRILFERLAPSLALPGGVKKIVIVPVGILNYVPFHALRNSDRYLVEDLDVSYAPSAGVWLKLEPKSVRKPENALFIGFADERIPFVESEVKTIAREFKVSKQLVGDKATLKNFQKYSRDFDVIHIACHGQFRADNPLFSSLHLADGHITVRDVCAGRIAARLVTLSACETGLNTIFPGEEILGLARGFLSAGAASLILSLWTVSDASTSRLMQDFYANLQRGTSIAASLRHAQKKFIDEGAHPYFWAPFALVGN